MSLAQKFDEEREVVRRRKYQFISGGLVTELHNLISIDTINGIDGRHCHVLKTQYR